MTGHRHDEVLEFLRLAEEQQIERYRREVAERDSDPPPTTSAQTYAEALAAAQSPWLNFNTQEN